MFSRTETAPSSARLSVTASAQVCASVCITVCDTLRVRVPPSAKLNFSSPFLRSLRGASSFQVAPTPCPAACVPAEAAIGKKNATPQSPAQLPCYCPLIHCSEAEGGWNRGSKGLRALYIQDAVIWQRVSRCPGGQMERGGSGTALSLLCNHF